MPFREWKYIDLIKVLLEFVSKGPINNIPSLFQKTVRRQAIICTIADPIDRRIYAALGWDELSNEVGSYHGVAYNSARQAWLMMPYRVVKNEWR